MLQTPMDVLTQFPVRKTKKQKQALRDAVCVYSQKLGYTAAVEAGSFGTRNVVIGDPEKAKYLLTAHYDTSVRWLIPNFQMPCNPFVTIASKVIQCLVFLFFALLTGFSLSLLLCGVSVLLGDPLELSILSSIILTPLLAVVIGLPLCAAILTYGNANKNNSNDNSSGIVTVLEIMRTLPENQRDKVCCVLFDLHENGHICTGAMSHRKQHKAASDTQLIINLDCVGDGDHLVMIPTKALKKDRKRLTSLYKACGYFGKKSILVHEKGFAAYPSDQMRFPYGVGICSLKQSKHGLYISNIHTPRDTVLDETNVNILRAALTSYICCDAAQYERK